MKGKRAQIEAESLKGVIAQNKEYATKQEERMRDMNIQYQKEILEQRKKHEDHSLEQMK